MDADCHLQKARVRTVPSSSYMFAVPSVSFLLEVRIEFLADDDPRLTPSSLRTSVGAPLPGGTVALSHCDFLLLPRGVVFRLDAQEMLFSLKPVCFTRMSQCQ